MWAMKVSVLLHHRGVRTAVKFLVPPLLVGTVVYRESLRRSRWRLTRSHQPRLRNINE